MGIFDRFKKKPSNVPFYATMLSEPQFETFKLACIGYFQQHSVEADFNFEEGFIVAKSGFLEGNELGLHNVVHHLAGVPVTQYGEVVDGWFGQFWDLAEQRQWLDNTPFERVKEVIRISIYPRNDGQELEGLKIADSLVGAPVADLEKSTASISQAGADIWGISFPDLVELGIENSIAHIRDRTTINQIQGETALHGAFMIHEPDCFCVASGILHPDAIFNVDPAHGYLVAIPNRTTLLAVPLTDTTKHEVLDEALRFATHYATSQPAAICAELYWVFNSDIRTLGFDQPVPNREAVNALIAEMGWS